jgi:hypothetical protein
MTFADPAPQVKRDRWGRPEIIGLDGKPYFAQRATTFAGMLDDTHGLTDWKCRQAVLGIVDRQDLRIAAAAHRDAKKELKSIVAAAQEAAGSSAAATMGTALHRLTELIDTGKPTGQIPDELAKDVESYREATAGMRMLQVETFVVIDELQVAGTFDRQVEFEGAKMIMDLKSGSSLDFGVGKFALQLALYSMGVVYNPATGERTPLDVDPDWAILVHTPVGKGKTDVYFLDIAAGREAIEHAAWVRDWRRRKDLLSLISPERLGGVRTDIVQDADSVVNSKPEAAPTDPFTAPDLESLEEWIARAPTRDILVQLWNANQGMWREAHTRLASSRGVLLDAGMVS